MLTASVENWDVILPELKTLLPAHWEELALNKEHVPLDPQYDVYNERNRRGELMFIGVRSAGQLVGYFVGFVAPGLHYQTCLTCTMDVFYIWPEYRGQHGGQILFRAVEKECRRRGVNRIFVGSKMHKDASWLFQKMGYTEVERYYSMWLGD